MMTTISNPEKALLLFVDMGHDFVCPPRAIPVDIRANHLRSTDDLKLRIQRRVDTWMQHDAELNPRTEIYDLTDLRWVESLIKSVNPLDVRRAALALQGTLHNLRFVENCVIDRYVQMDIGTRAQYLPGRTQKAHCSPRSCWIGLYQIEGCDRQ